jgi:hypothetical protein
MTYEEWLAQVPVGHRIALCEEITALLVVTTRQRRARKRR